jgi:hypothetical protein
MVSIIQNKNFVVAPITNSRWMGPRTLNITGSKSRPENAGVPTKRKTREAIAR